MSRRYKRRPELYPNDAERFYRASLAYREALIQLQLGLKPYKAHFNGLDEIIMVMHKTLEDIAGKKLDFRASDLGLLDPPG